MSGVAITGFGVHGAFGDASATAAALADGASAVTAYRLPGFPELRAAPAAAFDLDVFVPDRKQVKYMSPATQLAVVAAGRALASAGLLGSERLAAAALFVATGPIAFDLSSLTRSAAACRTPEGGFDLRRMGSEGLRLCHPLLPFKMLLNMPLALVSITFGVRGENFAVYPGADQAGIALEAAVRGIRGGRFARALVGGSVQGLSPLPLAALLRRGFLATNEGEDGWAVADMAAFLVLESEAAVEERRGRALGSVDDPCLARPTGSARTQTERSAAAERESADVLARVLRGDAPPRAFVTTGTLTREGRERLCRAIASRWPGAAPRVSSWDDRLGYAAAASVVAAVGLAAVAGTAGAASTAPPVAGEGTIVLSCAPGESLFTCRVSGGAAPRPLTGDPS